MLFVFGITFKGGFHAAMGVGAFAGMHPEMEIHTHTHNNNNNNKNNNKNRQLQNQKIKQKIQTTENVNREDQNLQLVYVCFGHWF